MTEDGAGESMDGMKLCFLMGIVMASCGWAGEVTSFYSSTDPKSVAVLSSSELEKEPEIDHFRHLCPGYGGYELIHHGGDLRSAIDVKFGKTISDIYHDTLQKAPGMFPHKANDVVEWRGVREGDQFVPHAIIYRLAGSVEVGDEGEQVTKTNLVVVALRKGEAEVLGAFAGEGEGEKARVLADTELER